MSVECPLYPRKRTLVERVSIEETRRLSVVRDYGAQALVYVYCESEPGRRSAAKLLTKDEARRIAVQAAGVS